MGREKESHPDEAVVGDKSSEAKSGSPPMAQQKIPRSKSDRLDGPFQSYPLLVILRCGGSVAPFNKTLFVNSSSTQASCSISVDESGLRENPRDDIGSSDSYRLVSPLWCILSF